MIQTADLCKNFGSAVALLPLSMEIPRGQCVGLVGANGAGKSTLLKLLAGHWLPSSGQIFLGPDDTWNGKALPAHVGYQPERFPFYKEMETAAFLKFCCQLRKMEVRQSKEALERVRQQLELGEVWSVPCGALSQGFQQRVSLAQAFLHDPQILLLDEPTSHLDPVQKKILRDALVSWGKRKTVIVSSHDLRDVTSICDRVLILRRGQLVLDAAVLDLASTDALERALLAVEGRA